MAVACNKSSTAAETHAAVCGRLELAAGPPEWAENEQTRDEQLRG
jgi:hypothetical protein